MEKSDDNLHIIKRYKPKIKKFRHCSTRLSLSPFSTNNQAHIHKNHMNTKFAIFIITPQICKMFPTHDKKHFIQKILYPQ